MTPYTDALEKLGWHPQADPHDRASGNIDMYTIAQEAARHPAQEDLAQEDQTQQDEAYFTSMDLALYIAAETAPRYDDQKAFIPYINAFQDDNWRRQAAERLYATSIFTNIDQAFRWTERADKVVSHWHQQGH